MKCKIIIKFCKKRKKQIMERNKDKVGKIMELRHL